MYIQVMLQILQKTTKKQNVFNGFSMVCSVTEGRCRGVVRLESLPKAAYFEGRCPLLPFRFIGRPSITPRKTD